MSRKFLLIVGVLALMFALRFGWNFATEVFNLP